MSTGDPSLGEIPGGGAGDARVPEDRRDGRRVTAQLPAVLVLVATEPARVEGHTVDLSRGGCRLQVHGDVPPGRRGVVVLRHAGGLVARPVGDVWSGDGGQVRLVFAATRRGGEEWDALLSALADGT